MRNDYFALSRNQQVLVLEQAAIKQNLPKQAIEKDLWVTAIIQILFSLPCKSELVFKGGTSLSKVWGMISRFSEDIDLAIDRSIFGLEGDLTKKKVKQLRKESSVFVRDELCAQLKKTIIGTPLRDICSIVPQSDGKVDATYPEPRVIYVNYDSVFQDRLSYIRPTVMIEAGSRSLLEPTENMHVTSLIEAVLPTISTTIVDSSVRTAIAEKTFLEKAFLLHELFSINDRIDAKRRSRHLYDLFMMMQKGVAQRAIHNDELWMSINHHRSTITSIQGVDYTPDIRDRIQLIPPIASITNWSNDYNEMVGVMIYNNPPSFDILIEGMRNLEILFKNR